MTDKAKHTPTPWSFNQLFDGQRLYGLVIHPPHLYFYGDKVNPTSKQDLINIKHIVRCVNSHNALVEACGELTTWIKENTDAIPYALIQGEQALKQAEE